MRIIVSLILISAILLIPISSAQSEYHSIWKYKANKGADIDMSSNSLALADGSNIILLDMAGKRILDKKLSNNQVVSISSDGEYVATYLYENEEIKIEMLNKKGESVWKSQIKSSIDFNSGIIPKIDISDDGEFTTFSENNNIHLFDKSGKELWSYPLGKISWGAVSISGNGSLITTSAEGEVFVLDNKGKLLWSRKYCSFSPEHPSIDAVEISTNGEFIVFKAGRSDCGVLLLDDGGNLLKKYSDQYFNMGASVSSTGDVAILNNPSKVSIFSAKGNLDSTVEKGLSNTRSIKLSENGDFLAVTDWDKGVLMFAKGLQMIFPQEGDVIDTSTPTVKWIGTEASRYILKIDGKEYETTASEFTPLEALSAGNHTWAIKSIDSGGKESQWSKTNNFLITTKEKLVTETVEVTDPTRTNYVWVAAIVIGIIVAGFFVRPYYKRAKLKREMAMTPTDWCPNCHKFTGGAKTCPHCGKKTLLNAGYDRSKKAKKK